MVIDVSRRVLEISVLEKDRSTLWKYMIFLDYNYEKALV